MNIAELKLQLINKIMQTDDASFALKAEQLLSNEQPIPEEIPAFNNNTVIAYRADGLPLTVKDLKREILQITDDSKHAAHCSAKTRLKGILWL
jgi:hypothetical protein